MPMNSILFARADLAVEDPDEDHDAPERVVPGIEEEGL